MNADSISVGSPVGEKGRVGGACGLAQVGVRIVLGLSCLVIPVLSSCTSQASRSHPDSTSVPMETTSPEEVRVEMVARAFLEALSETDTAALRGLMASEVNLSSVREGPGGAAIGHSTGEDFLASLGRENQNLLERMWEPTVLVEGRVAVVWTPYDFHLNGEFSHCGIDIFTLLKGEDGWRVTGVTYNVIREGCPPSPLGPPAR